MAQKKADSSIRSRATQIFNVREREREIQLEQLFASEALKTGD